MKVRMLEINRVICSKLQELDALQAGGGRAHLLASRWQWLLPASLQLAMLRLYQQKMSINYFTKNENDWGLQPEVEIVT